MKKGYLTPPVIIILGLICFFVGAALFANTKLFPKTKTQPVSSTSPLPSPSPKSSPDETTNWKTFKSSRIPLSFKYPPVWPVSASNDAFINQFSGRVEAVDFATTYIPNSRGDSFGYIIVDQDSKDKAPEQYLKSTYDDISNDLIIKKFQIGSDLGYKVEIQPKQSTKKLGGTFFAAHERYVVF